MAVLRFNRAILNGTEVTIADFVNGTGEVNYLGYDVPPVTTFDHVIHQVRRSLSVDGSFVVWGDKRSLNTDNIALDADNFGGTHEIYYSTTKLLEFKGLVTAKYSIDEDQTVITIKGESESSYTNTLGYRVTYNGNGNDDGTAPDVQAKLTDVPLTLRSNTGSLTKTGYTFDGWNTVADGTGTSYAVGASYTSNAILDLYAKWTAVP